MKTIACPACKSVSDFEAESCARCGESLAPAKLQHTLDSIRDLNAQMQHISAKQAGGFSSINGFGTTLLDYRPRGDGTWDAVRWVTALFIPLVPLGGYVIRPNLRENTYGRETKSFAILDRFPLTAQRVLRIYLLLVAGLLPLVAGMLNTRWVNRTFGEGPAFFVMLACGIWAAYVVFGLIKNDGKAYKPKPVTALK
jgi:hypothetical protein